MSESDVNFPESIFRFKSKSTVSYRSLTINWYARFQFKYPFEGVENVTEHLDEAKIR